MLEIKNLSKSYTIDDINYSLALDDITININDEDFITILGSNGAGKSTLFNCISGNTIPDKGKIILDGNDITYKPEHLRCKQIGRLFQDPLKGSAPTMTVEENLALAYLRANNSKGFLSTISNEDRILFKEKLKDLNLGLENKLNQPVGSLSGGQRQALTLLMATIVSPKLLLLDEHTAALDPSMAENTMNLTDRIIKDNKTTCLMITHNLSQALNYGNRLLIMSNGKIVLDINEKEKKKMNINDLLLSFKKATGKQLDNDRMMFE